MTAEEAYKEILSMSDYDLQNMSYTNAFWHCCVEGCKHKTRVKDFGIYPLFRWRKKWENVTKRIFYCGKHWKVFKKRPELIIYKSLNTISTIEYNTDGKPTTN